MSTERTHPGNRIRSTKGTGITTILSRIAGPLTTVTEKILSKAESVVAPTIRKLANSQFEMSEREAHELYAFVALMFVRVPAYREFLDASAAKMMKMFAKEQASDREEFYRTVAERELFPRSNPDRTNCRDGLFGSSPRGLPCAKPRTPSATASANPRHATIS